MRGGERLRSGADLGQASGERPPEGGGGRRPEFGAKGGTAGAAERYRRGGVLSGSSGRLPTNTWASRPEPEAVGVRVERGPHTTTGPTPRSDPATPIGTVAHNRPLCDRDCQPGRSQF